MPIVPSTPPTKIALLQVSNLNTHFPIKSGILQRTTGWMRAVDGVSFDIAKGETLGLVGESGCGKTTVGRTLLRLIPRTSGQVVFDGQDVYGLSGAGLKAMRRRMQIIFQDPASSLNPRMRIVNILGEPLMVHGICTDKSELRAIIENLGPTLKLQMINSIIKHDLRRTAMIQGHVLCPTGLLPTDAGFVCGSGIPTASLIAGPNYLYDAADTLDKIEKKDLVPVAKVFIELIEAIDATPSALIGVPFVGDLLRNILYDPLANPGPDPTPAPTP